MFFYWIGRLVQNYLLQAKYCTEMLSLCPPVLRLVFVFIFGIYWIFSAFILSHRWAFLIFIALLKLGYTFIWWRNLCSQPIWSLLSPVTKLVGNLFITFTSSKDVTLRFLSLSQVTNKYKSLSEFCHFTNTKKYFFVTFTIYQNNNSSLFQTKGIEVNVVVAFPWLQEIQY